MATKLEEAYFGIKLWDSNTHQLKTANIFDILPVRESVAAYKVRKPETHDWLMYCFNSVWSRCQYEFLVDGWVDEGHKDKVDVYSMYIEPNKKVLKEIIDNITITSCKKCLTEARKRRKEIKKYWKDYTKELKESERVD